MIQKINLGGQLSELVVNTSSNRIFVNQGRKHIYAIEMGDGESFVADLPARMGENLEANVRRTFLTTKSPQK